MNGRIYTLEFENQSITNAGGDRDLFYVAPADDKPIKIIGWHLAQFSDVKDAEEEVLRLRIIRGHATVGSGGTPFTNSALYRQNPSDVDAVFTARHNDTTIASAGTAFVERSFGYNVRIPMDIILPERLWIPCTQVQGSVVMRLMAGPVDDLTMSGSLFVMEEG
jgi:hypothetical protein